MSNGNGPRTTSEEVRKLSEQIQDSLTQIEKIFGIPCKFQIIFLSKGDEDVVQIIFSKKIRRISVIVPRQTKGSLNAVRKLVLNPIQSILT